MAETSVKFPKLSLPVVCVRRLLLRSFLGICCNFLGGSGGGHLASAVLLLEARGGLPLLPAASLFLDDCRLVHTVSFAVLLRHLDDAQSQTFRNRHKRSNESWRERKRN
jgi:hypothetical protein